MSNVKRYYRDSEDMMETPLRYYGDGSNYVRESDYEAKCADYERLRDALEKMNATALAQVKVLFDSELKYSKTRDATLARLNDDKARFLLMYFPEIMQEAFAYRESLGADEALRLALTEQP